MGIKYGLFLRNTLDKGNSSSTLTFGNEEGLSAKEDFLIDEVELWTVDMSLWYDISSYLKIYRFGNYLILP